jgi:hypothetical protein
MITGASAEGVWMLVIDDLGEATVERAGALVAREHAAARQVRPELPAGFGTADVCAVALQRLLDSGHGGLVATDNGRTVAVMTAAVRQHPAGGQYARLPADGWSRYSTAPRHRCSRLPTLRPSPAWSPSTAPCARAAPSTWSPALTGGTSACSPSS